MEFKGPVEFSQAGDKTYIKISGKNAYTFFFISPERRKISSYHIDGSRDTLPATVAMNEAIRTVPPDEKVTLINGWQSFLSCYVSTSSTYLTISLSLIKRSSVCKTSIRNQKNSDLSNNLLNWGSKLTAVLNNFEK